MTTLAPDVDLTDLDLFDDDRHHGQCKRCYPTRSPLGVPFTAFCGVRAVWLRYWTDPATAPPNVCPECLNRRKCATCAGRPR